MDPKIILALIGLATAVVGAVTAALGRKKEIIHRHEYGSDERKRSFTAVGWYGIVAVTIGIGLLIIWFIVQLYTM